MWNGDIITSLAIDETGAALDNQGVWTGTGTNGLPAFNLFSAALGDSFVRFGITGFPAFGWISQSQTLSNNPISGDPLLSLYAISEVQTVVPEPSSLVLLTIGAVGLFGYGWRRRRKLSRK